MSRGDLPYAAAFHLMEQPIDGACPGWRFASRGNGPHRSSDPPRAGWRRRGAAFVEATTVFQPAVRVVAEEVGRADGAIGPRDPLVLVVQIGERKCVCLREALQRLEQVRGVGVGVVGADRGETDTLHHQRAGVGDEAVDRRRGNALPLLGL